MDDIPLIKRQINDKLDGSMSISNALQFLKTASGRIDPSSLTGMNGMNIHVYTI